MIIPFLLIIDIVIILSLFDPKH